MSEGSCDEQSAQYWKSKYEETKAELDEFASSSRELEQELDRELQESLSKNAALQSTIRTLQDETTTLKEQQRRDGRRIEALEDQIKNYDSQKQSLLQYRRELEQKNDELETANRNLTAAFTDHAKRIEALIEEKALLENELEHTRSQKEVEQRLRDELKDLRDELTAKKKTDEARQKEQRERRRTLDQNLSNSVELNAVINRAQTVASGDFTTNGHDNHSLNDDTTLHKGCKMREAELLAAIGQQAESRVIIQNLLAKIKMLESKVLSVQKSPLRANGHL